MHETTMKPGDLVICAYRMPCAIQPWLDWGWTGRILEPSDDPKRWNGNNSERAFCELTKKLPVAYFSRFDTEPKNVRFTQHDSIDALIPVDALVRAVYGMCGVRAE